MTSSCRIAFYICLSLCPHIRGGRYNGINVTTGIMLCHDVDFAIPWIQLHIHGFHWMASQRFFPPRSLLRQRERERDAPLDWT